jgi:type II secretory pathway predicted ATPase ExeA
MYEARFGLKRRPFPPTPDSSLYYPSTPHEQALAPLVRAIREDEGLALLVGEPGTGKTLLGQIFLERLGAGLVSAFLPHSQFSDRRGLLQTMLFDLGLPYEDASEQVLRLRLTELALKTAADAKRFVVVIDEAHHLTPEMLEELRLLGNLEAGRKAFQVLCLAQSPILQTLKQPALAAWNQRLAVRSILPALTPEEAHDYLQHHVRLAGGRADKIFDDESLDTLSRGSRGIPRLLNQAAHQALQLADAGELDHVDVECAAEALARLGIEDHEAASEPILDLHAVNPGLRRSA